MKMLSRLVAAAGLLALSSGTPSFACGPDSDCRLGDRHYRIRMPASHDGTTPIGAIVFAHGYRGNDREAMQSEDFAATAAQLNVAIISGKSAFLGWSLPGAPSEGKQEKVDELAYWDRVIEDAAGRFPIDRKRLLATGFSAGGMMVWNLACHRSTSFAGFAPIAGTFWSPLPPTCTTPPASLVHVHGDADSTVPLQGRRVRNTRQGAVPSAVAMYSAYGKFAPAAEFSKSDLRCTGQHNQRGDILNFCLFKGGHTLNVSHILAAWQMLVAAGKL